MKRNGENEREKTRNRNEEGNTDTTRRNEKKQHRLHQNKLTKPFSRKTEHVRRLTEVHVTFFKQPVQLYVTGFFPASYEQLNDSGYITRTEAAYGLIRYFQGFQIPLTPGFFYLHFMHERA
jgi:hypothetical protein